MAESEEESKPARLAWQKGQAALAAGNLAEAARWLDRAGRLAPEDDAIGLSRAVLRLREGRPSDAVDLLEPLLARHDLREGLLALAAGWAELDQPARAAQALAGALSRHVLPQDGPLDAIATRIAERAGADGWCGLRADGRLQWHRRHAATGAPAITLDGRPWRAAARLPAAATSLAVTIGGRHLLGSPLDLRRMRRVAGVVSAQDGGLEGWAWHPSDPDTDAKLSVCDADGNARFILVADDAGMVAASALARPRRFHVPAARIAGLKAPLQVRALDGTSLPGSPLDPLAGPRNVAAIAQAVARLYPLEGRPQPVSAGLALAAMPDGPRGAAPACRPAPRRRIAVVVPVHRGLDLTLACLAAVRATMPAGTIVIVVDDATPEPELAAALDTMARARQIRLLRQGANRGFPASANLGLRAAAALPGKPDVVLLNSDTRPAPGWLEALRAAVQATTDIGTACPLSNDATILSYPSLVLPNPPPEGRALTRLGKLAAAANPGTAVDIPTAVGFCMYIRRECLAATGLFREDVFAQGYGEENDFCRRAHHLGWRHVAVPGAYVAHVSGASFGAATAPLLGRNLALMEQLHPGYAASIARFQAADPLGPARRRMDAAVWRGGRARPARAVVLITHDQGGGVERVVTDRAASLRGEGIRPIILRPARALRPGDEPPPGVCLVEEPGGAATPSLRYALPEETAALAGLLRADRVERVELHHLLGHDHDVLRLAKLLGVPVEVHLHDYAAFCPRISLLGPDRRYCGEPAQVSLCEACVTDAGSNLLEPIGVAALRRRSAADLAAAARIIAPSADAAARLRRHFPAIRPEVAPLQSDADLPRLAPAPQTGRRRVAVVGAIGPEKGYDVLLACARDAAQRDLNLEFIVIGHTVDDQRLMDTDRAFVTGRYTDSEAGALIRAQRAQIGFIPSIWPETWCFALGTAWRAGLAVACFDIGAQGERMRATGRGWLLPLGLPTVAINNALLTVSPVLGDV